MHKLIQTLARYPVFPLFGGGRSLMQPVFADDLAAAIVAAIHVSANVAYWFVRAIEWAPRVPITSEQVLRLREDKVFDISAAVADLGFRPRPFAAGIAEEVRAMKAAGQW